MIHSVLSVALGGAAGSVARYAVSALIGHTHSSAYPLSTTVVNVAGCLLIGLISELAAAGHLIGDDMRLFLTVGFCGGFTTFSTFCNENMTLLRGGHIMLAAAYTAVSVVLGLLAVYAGILIARRI